MTPFCKSTDHDRYINRREEMMEDWAKRVTREFMAVFGIVMTAKERDWCLMYAKSTYSDRRRFFLNLHDLSLAQRRDLALAIYSHGRDGIGSDLGETLIQSWEQFGTPDSSFPYRWLRPGEVRHVLETSAAPIEKAWAAVRHSDVHDALVLTADYAVEAARMHAFAQGCDMSGSTRLAGAAGKAQWEAVGRVVATHTAPWKIRDEWRTSDAVTLARVMQESGQYGNMPVLSDALQDASCNEDWLPYLQEPIWYRGNVIERQLLIGEEHA